MPVSFVDLSWPLSPDTRPWPGDPYFEREQLPLSETAWFAVSRISMGSHTGTHVDAPKHAFPEKGASIDAMPPECFYGPAAILRIPCLPAMEIGINDLIPFEKTIASTPRIIIATGWSALFGTERYFVDPPSLTPEAAKYLAEKKIVLLGVDTPSPSMERLRETHEILLGAEIAILENLTNLRDCPDSFTLSAFPLPIAGCDASPVRAIAVVDSEQEKEPAETPKS